MNHKYESLGLSEVLFPCSGYKLRVPRNDRAFHKAIRSLPILLKRAYRGSHALEGHRRERHGVCSRVCVRYGLLYALSSRVFEALGLGGVFSDRAKCSFQVISDEMEVWFARLGTA